MRRRLDSLRPVRLTLTSCEVSPLDLRLRSAFGIAGGVQTRAANGLVRVELSDGTVGLGEAAPLPAYNGETQAQALAVLRQASVPLVGEEARDWRALAGEFRRRGGGDCGAAQCAFEVALLDALAKHEGRSLMRWFGGAGASLETDMTITTGTPAEAAQAAHAIRQRGLQRIKVKIGGADVAHDLERLQAIHEVAPDAPLILDGNAALTRADAVALVEGLRRRAITPWLLEQWLAKDDLAGLRELRLASGWTVVADESVVTADDVRRVASAGAADMINVKLMKAGVATALEVIEAAEACGLARMIGGNVESELTMSVSLALATGRGGFAHGDLDTPLFFLKSPFAGGLQYDGRWVRLDPEAPGHGVRLVGPADR